MRLTDAERDRILRATYLPDHRSREFVLTVVGDVVAERMAQAWDEGSEAAYYDPEVRGFVAVDDNPYRSDPSGPEVPDALAGLPGVSDQGAVSLADEGPLASPAGEAEVDHERGRLGAVGVGRPAASGDWATDPELKREVGIHEPILDHACSAPHPYAGHPCTRPAGHDRAGGHSNGDRAWFGPDAAEPFVQRVADQHFPWHYTEFGVLCACGRPCDGKEDCAVLRRARRWDVVIPPGERT